MAARLPPAFVSPPNCSYSQANIDRETFELLESLGQGAAANNVLDLDPFSVNTPSNLPPSSLFYFMLETEAFTRESYVRETELGYWRTAASGGGLLAGSLSSGTKTTLEFYEGVSPYGQKTDWLMEMYSIRQYSLGFNCLCRVFVRSDGRLFEDHSDDGDSDLLRAIWLSVADDNSQSFQNPSSRSQVVNSGKLLPTTTTGGHLNNLRTENSSQQCEFLGGAFLELNDLETSASTSFRSENSLNSTMNSEDYFDSEALLCEIDMAPLPNVNEATIPDINARNVSSNLNISSSRGSHQVLIEQPPSGPSRINGSVPISTTFFTTAMVLRLDASYITHPKTHVIEAKPNSTSSVFGSGASEVNELNQGPSTSHVATQRKRKTGGRFAKLGKKFCCLICF